MMNKREIDKTILNHFENYKEVLILLGSRQSGKTTLLKRLFPDSKYLLVDNDPVRKALESYDVNIYRSIFAKDKKYIIIDEIHLLSDPGRAAKIIYDQLDVNLIITGSSSFHIKNKTSESLAGRKIDYNLFPLTFAEFLHQSEFDVDIFHDSFYDLKNIDKNPKYYLFDMDAILNQILVYGLYPGMLNHPKDKLYLMNFIDSLIFKDLIELNLIENRRAALDLLKLLAYQIGNLINYSELASSLKIDQRTVKRYIEIFEQSFIIYRLNPISKNSRSEIIKSSKIYFYDVGLRNAIINNFEDINVRPDKGALFENFIISEFIKYISYKNKDWKLNFWRTKQKNEIDLVVSEGDEVTGIEIKFSGGKFPRSFKNHFPEANYVLLSKDNFF